MSSADVFAQILAYALTAVLWAWLWLHIITKIGYRGLARRLWLVSMCIPPLLGVAWILLFVLPWPAFRELKQLRQENEKLARQNAINEELKRLK